MLCSEQLGWCLQHKQGPFSLQEGNNQPGKQGIPLSSLAALGTEISLCKSQLKHAREDLNLAAACLGLLSFVAAGAVAHKLSLHPKAAGNAGEQHTLLYFQILLLTLWDHGFIWWLLK